MRINIQTSKNSEKVPFDHVHKLTGVIHKWLGKDNQIHGTTPLLSFSWLKGAKVVKDGLHFPHGASFFISAYDQDVIKKVIKSAMQEPDLFCGLFVKEISMQNTPDFDKSSINFHVASPVLIKKKENEHVKHLLYNDPEAKEVLTNSIHRKMEIAGMDPSGFSIQFDQNYPSPSTKLIDYKGIKNRANICPVTVEGSAEQIAFVWNVGIGHSTGIGFGALK